MFEAESGQCLFLIRLHPCRPCTRDGRPTCARVEQGVRVYACAYWLYLVFMACIYTHRICIVIAVDRISMSVRFTSLCSRLVAWSPCVVLNELPELYACECRVILIGVCVWCVDACMHTTTLQKWTRPTSPLHEDKMHGHAKKHTCWHYICMSSCFTLHPLHIPTVMPPLPFPLHKTPHPHHHSLVSSPFLTSISSAVRCYS